LQHRDVGDPQRVGGQQAQPGIEKTVSTVIAPETMKPRLSETRVTTGQERVADAVPPSYEHVVEPLGASGLEVVLAHLVQQADRMTSEYSARYARLSVTTGAPGATPGR
jgi:hypothetical protein